MEGRTSAGACAKWWMTFGLCLALVTCTKGSNVTDDDSNGVEIKHLTVPHSIENGTKAYADLDCEYKLKNNDTNLLEVTWHYREIDEIDVAKEKIVYKWTLVPNNRRPYGILTNRIDTNYTASNIPWEMYRALRIIRPTTEISGHYRCDVSTTEGHKTEGSLLIVYSKPKEYDLEVTSGQDENTVNVSCWASRTYPEAKLTISYEQKQNDVKFIEMNEESAHVAGAYDVRVFSTIDRKLLPASTKISCDIKIPNTGYLERKQVHYKGFGPEDENSAAHRQFQAALLFFLLLHIFF